MKVGKPESTDSASAHSDNRWTCEQRVGDLAMNVVRTETLSAEHRECRWARNHKYHMATGHSEGRWIHYSAEPGNITQRIKGD